MGTDWTGAVRCDIRATAPGYLHEERQTWTLTGAPAVQGSYLVFPATWAVAGHGTHDRTRNANRRVASWVAEAPAVNAPVSFLLAPVTGQISVQVWHAQLTRQGGYTGTDQFINGGVPQPPGRLVATLYELPFPKIPGDPGSTRLSGATTFEVKTQVGPLQPLSESQVTVACAWELGRGSANPLPPSTIPDAPSSPATSSNANPPATNPAGNVSGPATAPVNSLPALAPGGGLTAIPATTTGTTPANPVDPANFTATQTADGTVRLSWSAVSGAGSYMLGGPGTDVGVTVNGTSYTVTGIAPGTHTWTVATRYNPGGVLTTSDRWSRATATVVNRSGRYRIAINGFRVNRETNAGTFGEHNAVYAAAEVEVLNRQNNFALAQYPAIVRSLVHGDTSRDATRVRAGSASSTGGLLAGDLFPPGQNPGAVTSPPTTTTFPLQLWEGPLTDGVEAVVVRPTLWVWNGRPNTFDFWQRASTSAANIVQGGAVRALEMSQVQARAGSGDLTPFRETTNRMFPCYSDTIVTLEYAQCQPGRDDRPIGLSDDPTGGPNAVWLDLVVVVTREAVERALAASSQTGGVLNGLIVINLRDSGANWSGNYDLYLRVQRVP